MEQLSESSAACTLWTQIRPRLTIYQHDHYRFYPSQFDDGWRRLLQDRVDAAACNPEATLVVAEDSVGLAVGVLTARSWDEEHFGFGMATAEILFSDAGTEGVRGFVSNLLEHAVARGLRFISARVNGDQLAIIHALENRGFHYFEDIIWPVVSVAQESEDWMAIGVRPMRPDDIEIVCAIAGTNQYQRGHFHCDPGFAIEKADSLYARWVRTAFEQQQPVLVIEDNGEPAGYFVLDIEEDLSTALGARYGGLRSLGVKADARGKGLGQRLFRGALAWLGSQGCEYVDSGYATKNHASSKLHANYGFKSVYEEVTLHRWLA